MNKQATVLVVAWNSRADVERCLGEIPPGAAVVVADNGSSDGTAGMVRARFPATTLIENGGNLGFAAAVNRALPSCRTDYVLLLNPDASMEPGCLEALAAFLDGRPAAVAAGPRILDGERRPRRSGGSRPRRVPWLEGSCLLLRRAAFERVGPLDERFFLYYEEIDWLRRAAAAGGEAWLVPAAAAVHRGPGRPGHYDEHRLVHLHRSRVAFEAKHGGRARAAVLRGVLFARSLARIAAWSAVLAAVPRLRPAARSSLRGYRRVLGLLLRGEGT